MQCKDVLRCTRLCVCRLTGVFLVCASLLNPGWAAPDEEVLGRDKGYPIAPSFSKAYEEAYRVGSFSGMDQLSNHCVVKASQEPMHWTSINPEPQLYYRYRGSLWSLDDYMQRQRATAVVVVKDDQIVAQRTNYGRKPQQRLLSNSMSKTIVALAVGKALETGHIRSLEDFPENYEPRLRDTFYGKTNLLNLLRMASGAQYTEDYSGNDDHTRFSQLVRREGLWRAAKTVTQRATPPGEVFNYASSHTQILGAVVRAATGQTLCDWVSTQIWQPMGAESDATWLTNPVDGTEIPSGNFNATARDYARLAMLLANDGMRDGKSVISKDYLLRMTDAQQQPYAFRPGVLDIQGSRYLGYGLHTWLLPGSQRRFALLGIYGQAIFVDPQLRLAMVHLAVGKDAADDRSGHHLALERDALWRGVVAHYGASW